MSKKMVLISVVAGVILVLGGVLLYLNHSQNTQLPQQDVTLNIWGTFETTQNIQPFISAYTDKHPNVTINYTEKDVSTYEQDLINALATGTGPDIFAIHNDWLPKYQDKIVAAPSNIINLKYFNDTFVDAMRNDFVKDGQIYGVASSVDSLGLYYNKDILGTVGIATPPKTWQELRKDVTMITKSDSSGFFTRSGVAMGTVDNINRAVDILYLLMYQAGTVPYTSDNSQSTLNQSVTDQGGNSVFPAAVALKYYLDFADPNTAAYTWNAKSNYSIDSFANGQLAFMYGYSFTRDTIMQKSPNLNFDVAPVPQFNLNNNAVNFANYWGYVVSKQTKNSNYAWNFLNFMTGKDQLEAYYTRHKLPSSRKDIIAEQINDPDIGVFAAENLTAKTFYKKEASKVDQIFADMINAVVKGNQAIDEAVSAATGKINLLNSQ